MRDSFLTTALPTALLLWACGGGSGGQASEQAGGISQSTAFGFEGIYSITSFNENASGCDSEGTSVLANQLEHYVLITSSMVLGKRVVWFTSCSDPAACRANAAAIAAMGGFPADFSYFLTAELSPTELSGFEASTGFFDNGVCTERTYSDLILSQQADDTIRFEERQKLLSDRPPEDGFCVVRPAESSDEAAQLPCSSLRVIQAVRAEAL